MCAYVEITSFLGEQAVKAGNDQLEIFLIPSWGSNLISMVEKKTGIELLRVPNDREEFWNTPVLYGTPILFPPNRIDGGMFTFNNEKYQFDINEPDKNNHIHGFVHTRKWELRKAEIVDEKVIIETEFYSAIHDDVKRQFPHDFCINMSYILDRNTLQKNGTIKNLDKKSFPWGLGFHTTFFFPEDSSLFSLTASKRWKLNERFLPTGVLKEIEYVDKLQKGMSLKNLPLDDAFLSSVGETGKNEAVITHPVAGIKIVYKVDENFKHWVVYNKDGQNQFVCLEPYTWVTNAPNLDLPPSLTGLQVLEPGEEKVVKTEIKILVKES